MLLQWTQRRTIRLVQEALDAADVREGWVVVVDRPVLARALASGGRRVLAVATRGRSGARGQEVLARLDALPLGDGTLAAVVGTSDPGEAPLAEWMRALRDGGAVVLIDRGAREEQMRRALCAGLVDLEQRGGSRGAITSGRARKLPSWRR